MGTAIMQSLRKIAVASFITTALCVQCCADEAVKVLIKPSADGDTGTMHYAEAVELRMGDGIPALIKTDVKRDQLAPEEILLTKKIGPNLAMVFGFSSWGGGNQTLHAIIVKYSDHKTEITDHLKMTVRRGDGGFLWSSEGELFLVKPTERNGDGDVFLESSRTTVKYAGIKAVKFSKAPKNATFLGGPSWMPKHDVSSKPDVLIPISKGRFDLSVFFSSFPS